jgi:hypothetical protein
MTTEPQSWTDAAMNLPSAKDICEIIHAKKQAKEAEERRREQAAEEERKHQREMFLARKLSPEFVARMMVRVRDAADTGASEIMLGHFPASWCSDGGRKINAPEESWPDTLQGFAREFFEFWERELKPRGFRLRVEIISFPGGMPGDVGAYLAWGSS